MRWWHGGTNPQWRRSAFHPFEAGLSQCPCCSVKRDAVAPRVPFQRLTDRTVKGLGVAFPVRTAPKGDNPILARGDFRDQVPGWHVRVFFAAHDGK